jgi:hypothetical protein
VILLLGSGLLCIIIRVVGDPYLRRKVYRMFMKIRKINRETSSTVHAGSFLSDASMIIMDKDNEIAKLLYQND